MHKAKTTEWHNKLEPTENELKIKACPLTLYSNHLNESKLMFGRTPAKNFRFFFIIFFFSIVNSICVLWQTFFYKSTAPTKNKPAVFGTVSWKSAFCDKHLISWWSAETPISPPPLKMIQKNWSEISVLRYCSQKLVKGNICN